MNRFANAGDTAVVVAENTAVKVISEFVAVIQCVISNLLNPSIKFMIAPCFFIIFPSLSLMF